MKVDQRGYPVPWFVAWIDGVPDFRVVASEKIVEAIRFKRCWVCGEERGRNVSFVIGPMCAVNRVSAEPPCHRDCAIYAALACPFLTRPKMKRNDKDMPEGLSLGKNCPGRAIARNPGVALVWTTREFEVFRPPMGNNGYMFSFGDPDEVLWFAEGRAATRAEVLASIESGVPILREACQEAPESVRAGQLRQLEVEIARAMKFVPAEASAP